MLVAVVDDNPEEVSAIIAALVAGGERCQRFSSGAGLVAALRRETFDLVLLDWNMPGMSGLDVLGWMAEHHAAPPPVIMLTSRSASEDVIAALEAGAVDFIIKPEDPAVVRARARAAVRRVAPPAASTTVTFGSFAFDRGSGTLTRDGQPIELTRKEFEVALLLFENCNRPLSRGYMLQKVWQNSPEVETRTLDVHISRLRAKLNLRPDRGFSLQTVFGFGYRLESVEGRGEAA
ncbi:MAG: response regulator transcription factor [Proteobacteria bacterium]|nr:response regulator transcription factor [Pseudomonadota bacterium]